MCVGIPHGRHIQNVPFDGHVELGQIDADVDHIATGTLVHVSQVHLNSIAHTRTHTHKIPYISERFNIRSHALWHCQQYTV